MRVVKETANYGYFGNNGVDAENTNQLVASVAASNFSGPMLMQRLMGKCYNLTMDKYMYTFCPFHNFTQYEISQRWNAYQGILGIWSHWEIQNNTFVAMIHKNGDACGDVDRTVKVVIECGMSESLLNVTEPQRCQYSAAFSTRYACHRDALLVYPRLSSDLQKEWNQLYTELHYGDITQKGYDMGLQKILEKAGLSETISTKPTVMSTTTSALEGEFNDLSSCNQEYKKLQTEVSKLSMELETLKLLLDLNKIDRRTKGKG